MSEHAPLAPSSAAQWGNCSGSVLAQANMPNVESEKTREGTAAHWVVSEALEIHRAAVDKDAGRGVLCDSFIGRTAPNGVIIDERMADGAQVMVDSVMATWERWAYEGELLIEQRVEMPQIHWQNWGTLDTSLYVPEHSVLYLWDYKHGHRECPAENNLQMVDYLAGLVDRYRIDGLLEQRITVVVRIVQPFCYHSSSGPISEWVFTLSDLRAQWNVLHDKAHEVFSNPRLSTGIWCRDCDAVGTCSAARRAGYNFIDLVNEPYQMDDMTGADLAVELAILQDGVTVAKARIEAIEDNLHHRIRSGETDSGLTLEATLGREEWAIPAKQVVALAAQFGVDASKEAVKTPAQTRAAAPKAVRPMLADVLKTYVRRPAGALKLIPVGKSRTARAFQIKTEK